MWLVCWRVKFNGFSGHGQPLSYDIAAAWVKYANNKYPDMEHWVAPFASEV